MEFWRNLARHRTFKETLGIFLIAFTLLTVVSLVTYNSSDPSFNHAVSGKVGVKNYAGMVGAYLSDGLIQLLGSAAFSLPVISLALALLLFRMETLPFAVSLLGGAVLFLFSFCTLLFIFWVEDPYYPEIPAGGLMGSIVAQKLLIPVLARPGAAIVAFTLLLISFLVATRLGIRDFLDLVMELAGKLYQLAAGGVKRIMAVLASIKDRVEKRRGDEGPEVVSQPEINIEPPEIVQKPVVEKPKKGKKPEDEFEMQQSKFEFMSGSGNYSLPPLAYLGDAIPISREKSDKDLLINSQILMKKLADFGIEGRVTKVSPGPVITLYEFEPAAGVKVSRIAGLADDLAMGLRAVSIRILAPVPGKAVVGIEVPNAEVEPVNLKQMIASDEFTMTESKLTIALGKDTSGVPVVTNLAAIPHLLVAGATGSGKSVGVNAMIMSILYKATPAEVNFIMIDPKMLELSIYDGIPHLIAPVVTNPKKAANALRWAVAEMERRYQLLAECGFRNIAGYNEWVAEQLEEKGHKKPVKKEKPVTREYDGEGVIEEDEEEEAPKPLPYIVIIIDELADLMMVASKDVETALARLAQMARASGIHLIVATQRPSVDVLTGLIKANFPARISYQVTSRIDSRTILDTIGAEKLLGKGDMLFLPPGTSRLTRIHGPFVSDDEVKHVVKYLRKQGRPDYDESILKSHEKAEEAAGEDMEVDEEYFEQAVEIVMQTRQASISMIQRRLRIGYNRAARIVEQMEAKGMVGPADGAKPRQVLIPPDGDEGGVI